MSFRDRDPLIAHIQVVTRSSEDLVDLEELKRHLRVDFDDDDDQVRAYLQAAVDVLEGDKGYLGRALAPQTVDAYYSSWPQQGSCSSPLGTFLQLPMPPVVSITGVFVKDSAGDEQEMSPSLYTADLTQEPALLFSKSWPTAGSYPSPIRVRMECGYPFTDSPPVSTIPPGIVSALKLMVGDLYENREETLVGDTAVELPAGVPQILRKYRTHLGFA